MIVLVTQPLAVKHLLSCTSMFIHEIQTYLHGLASICSFMNHENRAPTTFTLQGRLVKAVPASQLASRVIVATTARQYLS